MTAKSFLGLTAATVIAVLLALLSSAFSSVGDAVAERGDPLVPNLANKANAVARFEMIDGDEKTVIVRKGSKFEDEGGYPTRPSVAKQLIANMALLTIEERKTSKAERLGELELGDADAGSGAGERVILKDASGKVIADVIFGQRDTTVGGVRGGQFVRRAGSQQAYLARGSVTVPVSRTDWFETGLGEIKSADLATAEAYLGETKLFSAKRDGGQLKLADVPEGREVEEARIQRIERLLEPVRFTDVRAAVAATDTGAPKVTPETKATAVAETKTKPTTETKATGDTKARTPAKATASANAQGPRFVATSKDGLQLTLQMIAPADRKDDPNAGWISITAQATKAAAPAAKKMADEFTSKTAGFEFKLSTDDTALLGYKIVDFLKEAKSE